MLVHACVQVHMEVRLVSSIFSHSSHYFKIFTYIHMYAQLYWLLFSLWIILALNLKSVEHLGECVFLRWLIYSVEPYVFILVAYCFGYCSFVVGFKMMWDISYLQIVLAIYSTLKFHMNFRVGFSVFIRSAIIMLWV